MGPPRVADHPPPWNRPPPPTDHQPVDLYGGPQQLVKRQGRWQHSIEPPGIYIHCQESFYISMPKNQIPSSSSLLPPLGVESASPHSHTQPTRQTEALAATVPRARWCGTRAPPWRVPSPPASQPSNLPPSLPGKPWGGVLGWEDRAPMEPGPPGTSGGHAVPRARCCGTRGSLWPVPIICFAG